jgi:hypothetical protein
LAGSGKATLFSTVVSPGERRCARFLREQGDKGCCMERFQEIEIEWEDYEKLLMYYSNTIWLRRRARAGRGLRLLYLHAASLLENRDQSAEGTGIIFCFCLHMPYGTEIEQSYEIYLN